MSNTISKNDYEKPCCPFTTPNTKNFIPIGRVIEKLDEYYSKNDTDSAEKHLKYWLQEAEYYGDSNGELSVTNELIGLYRKLGYKDKAMVFCENALELCNQIDKFSITRGTTYLNIATAYNAFGMIDDSLNMYNQAKIIYEKSLKPNDSRLAGLYNNTALLLVKQSNFNEALKLYLKALDILNCNENTKLEIAITYCNMADLHYLMQGAENSEKIVNDYLEKSYKLLTANDVIKDGYYAFVCDKCSATFGYYGFFTYQAELEERAKMIYEGN